MSMHEYICVKACVSMIHRDICTQILIGAWVCPCTNRFYVPDCVNVLMCKMYICMYIDMFGNEDKLVWGAYMCMNEFACALTCVCCTCVHACACEHLGVCMCGCVWEAYLCVPPLLFISVSI